MMSEDDDVFVSGGDPQLAPSAGNCEYTQIYGSDDMVVPRPSKPSHQSTNSFHASITSERTSEDTFDDNFDVYITNPRNKLKVLKPKKSLRSESSEDDTFDDVHIDRNGATRPLMYPRQRQVNKPLTIRQQNCRQCCRSFFYFVLLIGSLGLFAFLIVFLTKNYADKWLHVHGKKPQNRTAHAVVGCSAMSVEDVWVVGIPKLMTESAFRLVDVNSDGTPDILFGFATGAEGYDVPELVCDIYFGGLHPCLGGLLALDGATGQELWRHYSPHEIFAVNCNQDMDRDGVKDCLIAGRVGTFEAVSGKKGSLMWNFTHPARKSSMNLYTPQFVRDLDGDSVDDIINIHGGDPFGEPGSATRLVGRIFLFSGVDGRVLQWVDVPDGRESYYSPVVCRRTDGTDVVVFGTGGETHSGSLWFVTLDDLYKGDIHKAQHIVHNQYKGFMTPPVLLDLNRDGVEDLVFASYNSTVVAVDGNTFTVMWNFTYPMSETYATPSPGYYNSDDVPDFMVHWQYGPGFPVYFHSITTVLDGRDGRPLLTPYIQSSVGAQTSPLTVSVEGYANDIFLHWYADCVGHQGEGGDFKFVKGTNVHEQSRSDVCRLRFKSEGFSKLYALSSHQEAPGVVVYDSQERVAVEHEAWVNTTAEAQEFLRTNPEHQDNYAEWREWVQNNIKEKEQESGLTADDLDILDEISNPREHLKSSLAAITGQRPMEDNDDMSISDSVNSELNNDDFDINDIFSKSQPLSPEDMYLTPEKDGWSSRDSEAIPRPFSHNTHTDKTDSTNIDYMKKIYDALGLNADEIPRQFGDYRDGDLPADVDDDEAPRDDRLHSRFEDRRWGDQNRRQKRAESNRSRRHVGPHDEGGLQRLISTGSLAPPLLPPTHPDYPHSMDVVFATYWFYPAKTEAILPEDQKCIDDRMAEQTERFDPLSKYYGMDDDAYGHTVTKECLAQSKHQLPKHGTYNNQHTYNPYNVHMGQLTVYRMRLKCKCTDKDLAQNPDGRCSEMLPFSKQQWSSYMGSDGNSHWRPPVNDKHTNEL